MKTFTVDQVYNMLTRERFHQWYEEDFVDHISDSQSEKTEEQIKEDLQKMMTREFP